jgi:hypothetical protein
MKTHIPYRNFTTTLPEYMLADLREASEEMSVQKNDILIDAFTQWNKIRTQRLLAESYTKSAHDSEFQALAEDDIKDWGARVSQL